MQEHKAVVKEMEAAAIAWIADLMETPMFAIKAITDLVDPEVDTSAEFQANFGKATEALKDGLLKLLDYLDGTTVGALLA